MGRPRKTDSKALPEPRRKFRDEFSAITNSSASHKTVQQIGAIVAVSASEVSRWRTGEKIPTLDQLKKICTALEIPADEYLSLEHLRRQAEKSPKTERDKGKTEGGSKEETDRDKERAGRLARIRQRLRRMSRRNLVLLGAALLLVVGGFAWLGIWLGSGDKAEATSSCRAKTCDGLEPIGRCDEDARNLKEEEFGEMKIELRFSPKCQAAWAKIHSSTVGDEAVARVHGGSVQRNALNYPGDQHSRMIPASPGKRIKACGFSAGKEKCTAEVTAPKR